MSSTMMAQGGKYDNCHLHDHQFNRKLVYRFLRRAITLTEVAVRVVAGPADNHQDRECGATWKSVFPFHLIDELPHLMIDGRKPLSPLQARVDCANLFQCVLFGLQQLTKSQPGTLGRAIMISHQSKRGVSNNDKIGLTFQRAFHRSEESCRNVLHNLNQFTIGL